MAHRPGQSLGGQATEPDRRVRSLHRLGLQSAGRRRHGTGRGMHPRFIGPGRLHQFQALGEIRNDRCPSPRRRRRTCEQPPPDATPMSSRPWLSRSTAVTAEANWSGSCSDVTNTATPRRSRSVQAAQYASSSNGASSGAGQPSARAPSRPRTRVPRHGRGRNAARRRRRGRSRIGGWRWRTSPDHRTAADRYPAEYVRLPALDSRSLECGRHPRAGRPRRYRSPPRRTERLRARARPAFGAAGDDGL